MTVQCIYFVTLDWDADVPVAQLTPQTHFHISRQALPSIQKCWSWKNEAWNNRKCSFLLSLLFLLFITLEVIKPGDIGGSAFEVIKRSRTLRYRLNKLVDIAEYQGHMAAPESQVLGVETPVGWLSSATSLNWHQNWKTCTNKYKAEEGSTSAVEAHASISCTTFFWE